MSRRLALAAVLILAAAFPAAALDLVTFSPQVIRTGEKIEVRIPNACSNSPAPVVTRSGFEVTIRLTRPQPCTPETRVLELGPFRPGEYSVGVFDGNAPWAFGAFRVLGEGEQPFEVRPFGLAATGGVELHIRLQDLAFSLCPQLKCAIRIGGVEAMTKRQGSHPNEIVVMAPPTAPGLHDVSIANGGSTVTLPGAVFTFGPGAPDFTHVERILFPLNFDAPGAHGSLWRTESAIANPQPWPIVTVNAIAPFVCPAVVGPCTELLQPHSKLAWNGGTYPHGVALLVTRRDAEDLAFSLRVRDVSRVAEGFGTEVPVVRERDMDVGTMTLLDVPLDPRYRVKLRIYAFGAAHGDTGFVRYGGRHVNYTVTRHCDSYESCAATPAYAELDLPAGEPGTREIVSVVPPGNSLAWSFASVTNNDTQQVTLVTPDGTGGFR
ncbi:MAG TPA: hypothetical protein VGF28_01750 [Thermoanaerobaculia bacterium]